MLCPLKFSRYEFEGGEECIGAECGFYGGVCRGVGHTAMKDAHSKAQSKDAPTLSDLYGILSDESDSREKLEADALSFANGFIRDHNGAISWNDELYQGIIKLLDRQAAITEQECSVGHTAMRATIDRLQTTVDELYKSCDILRDKNRALKLHIGKMQAGRNGWHVKGVELQRQVDELTAQLHASSAERERLRECLGIATDNAHDFLTLVDESGNVYDRDEGLA